MEAGLYYMQSFCRGSKKLQSVSGFQFNVLVLEFKVGGCGLGDYFYRLRLRICEFLITGWLRDQLIHGHYYRILL